MQQQQQQPQQSATVVNVPGQPSNVQYVFTATPPPPSPPQPTVYPHFPKKPAVSVGVTLIVAGLLSIVFNIVELAAGETMADNNNYYYLSWLFGYIGHGFWVGIMCIIPGGIGIGAGIHKTRSRICAFNVMCVIAASFSAAQFGIGLAGAIAGPDCYYYYYSGGWPGNSYYEDDCDDLDAVAIAMEALLTVLAVVEAIVAIYGSVLCCRTYCCCSSCQKKPQPSATPYYGAPVTIISGNQQLSAVQYPVTVQAYQNAAYQPGYPGQPLQFTALPPTYSVQGQFVTLPNYPGMNHNVPMSNTAMVGGVQAFPSAPVGQLQTSTAMVHQQPPPNYSPPDEHNDGSSKLN